MVAGASLAAADALVESVEEASLAAAEALVESVEEALPPLSLILSAAPPVSALSSFNAMHEEYSAQVASFPA